MSQLNDSVDSYLAIMLFTVFVLSIVLVVYYAEPGFPWHTYITLVFGYFASFAVLLIVPIDIAAVIYSRKSSVSGHDASYSSTIQTLSIAYDTFFTIILILGSVVLVFEEYYNTDGDLIILFNL
jgi:hypothetical protein